MPSSYPPDHFVSLHQQIFKPTCATAGCHDGNFEPDFRTLESSYNTLVYHPLIKNDPQGTFTFRVFPGNPSQSVLYHRLLEDIDGQSGLMPLIHDDNWRAHEADYIAAIRQWIENGAPDMFGELPEIPDLPPSVTGLVAMIPGRQNPLDREGGNGKLLVPVGVAQIELFLSLQDENIPTEKLTSVKIRLSEDRNDFETAPGLAVQLMPVAIRHEGFTGEREMYFHHVSVDVSDLPLGTQRYLRVYIQVPGQNEPIEIPGNGSVDYVKEQFAFKIHD